MTQTLLLSTLLFLFLIPCFAQENSLCPNIKVVFPNEASDPGISIPFSVSPVEELNDLKLEYTWKTSQGLIEKGQGTPAILISTYGLENLNITATVEIKGLLQACPNTFSGTGVVGSRPRLSHDMGEFHAVSKHDELKDSFVIFYRALVRYDSTARGVIITYGTKKEITKRESAIRRIIRLRKYNIKRIKFIKAIRNQRTTKTEFFLVPQGATLPEP